MNKIEKNKIEKREVYIANGNTFYSLERAQAHLKEEEERTKKNKQREELRQEYTKLRSSLRRKIDNYERAYRTYANNVRKLNDSLEKKNFVDMAVKDVANKISEYRTQIAKLENAIKICNGSLKSHKREALAAFQKTPKMKELLKKRNNASSNVSRLWGQVDKLDSDRKYSILK